MRLLVLIVLILLFTNPVWAETASDDVPLDHWAYAAMDYLCAIGLGEKYQKGFWRFKSEWWEKRETRCLTRYEFAQGIARAHNSFVPENHPLHIMLLLEDLETEFSDLLNQGSDANYQNLVEHPQAYDLVPLDHWAYNAMDYLVDRGFLPEKYAGWFDKSRTLARYDFAMFTAILLDKRNENNTGEEIGVMIETLRAEFSTQIICY